MSLPAAFFARPVVELAEALVGCTVAHGGAAGVIVEAEAYHDSEPACHAFVGETPRTRVLFGPPGRAYVYRSYGVHAMLNAVADREGVGAAVLIRALEPTDGVEAMRRRRGGVADEQLCSGPGKLTQAMGIWLDLNDSSLCGDRAIVLGPRAGEWLDPPIVATTRVGINKAMELEWRFCVTGSRYVSRPRPRAELAVSG